MIVVFHSLEEEKKWQKVPLYPANFRGVPLVFVSGYSVRPFSNGGAGGIELGGLFGGEVATFYRYTNFTAKDMGVSRYLSRAAAGTTAATPDSLLSRELVRTATPIA